MPNSHPLPHPVSGQTPAPATITPALLKQHSITPDEYTRIEQHLGRTPSLTELGIFSVMWSEHCSYKSSRVHLKRLPTKGTRTSGPGAVVQGPGENAGIIDVGDGWACAFKIESHNHPSYIEPYQGAATGVGGILRDIFTMGARPLAVMDSLRFGPLTEDAEPDEKLRNKNHQVANGVVHGVAGYGNCFGVPNVGGETRFEPCYSGNPLLNAFALGLVRKDEIFYAKATGVGNPVLYVGAKTGRDGIHGATMASEEFTEGSEQKRPNVQMGDPFLEKLLLEACLEAMQTGAVVGIQDMGAAGLTCSTCEMGVRGELGVTIELDRVPQRETGMTSYEIMLSESQERMLLVAEKGRESEVLAVFSKWGLDCAEVGIVTADDVMRVTHSGLLVAEIPNKALTDDAPVYHRAVGTWAPPVPRDPPAWVLEELQKPRDYTADLLKLLASPNICDKRYIYEQYDSMVQTNTVQGPGFEAGVIRIKGTGAPARSAASEPVEGTPSSVSNPSNAPADSLADTAAAPKLTTAERIATSLGLDPIAADHTVLGRLANLVTGSHSGETDAQTTTGPTTLAEQPLQTRDREPAETDITNPTGAAPASIDRLNPLADHPAPTTPVPDSPTPYGAGTPATSPEVPGTSSLPHARVASAPKHERGLAMALAGNGRWCYLDPKLGAMHAVAEAARKVACTGATPVAATNCLNFGNPEKPEIMAQLSLAIDGIAEACTALGTPITGGNVSLYNETRGEGIYPTPVIGIVGILDDVTKAVPSGFQRAGEAVLLLTGASGMVERKPEEMLVELGATAFARTALDGMWGRPPALDIRDEASLHRVLARCAVEGVATSMTDVSDGGLAVAVAKAALANGVGLRMLPAARSLSTLDVVFDLFAETGSSVLLTCHPSAVQRVDAICEEVGRIFAQHIGDCEGSSVLFSVADEGFGVPIQQLQDAYEATLPTQLAAEVVTA